MVQNQSTTTRRDGDDGSNDELKVKDNQNADRDHLVVPSPKSNTNQRRRPRHRYRIHRFGDDHVDEEGDGDFRGEGSRGRELYRRRRGRSDESRSPSQPPGSCPVGCATLYYLLWVVIGCAIFPFVSRTPLGLTFVGQTSNTEYGTSVGVLKDSNKPTLVRSKYKTKAEQRLKPPQHETIDDNTSNDQNHRLQFVFIAGLPGSGYETILQILSKSPALTDSTSHIYKLQDTLWPTADADGNNRIGLWNAHCPHNQTSRVTAINVTTIMNAVIDELTITQKLNDDFFSKNRNTPRYEQRTLSQLSGERSSTSINHEATRDKKVITRIPINVPLPQLEDEVYHHQYQSHMSFPNGFTARNDPLGSPCRPLDYPNLDLLFHACDVAAIECKLLYLHDNPIHLLKHHQTASAAKILSNVHLLTSMLSIVTTDLFLSSNRVIGCLEVDPQSTGRGQLPSSSSLSWEDVIFDLFWGDGDDASVEDVGRRRQFDEILNSALSQTASDADANSQEFVPPQFNPYLNAFDLASDRAIDVCRQALRHLL